MADPNQITYQRFQLGQMTVGTAVSQGNQLTMEDRVLFYEFKRHLSDFKLTGVLDGHQGVEAAEFVLENLPKYMQTELEKIHYLRELNGLQENLDDFRGQLERILQDFDLRMQNEDQFFTCGSTLSACLHTPDLVFLVQIGDSTSLIKQRSLTPISTDVHKVTNQGERYRILRIQSLTNGQYGYDVDIVGEKLRYRIPNDGIRRRIQSTRSYGDGYFKKISWIDAGHQALISTPTIKTVRRNIIEDEFVASYTDGVSQYFSPSFISGLISDGLIRNTPVEDIATQIIRLAIARGGDGVIDNKSIIIAVYSSMFKKIATKRISQCITHCSKANLKTELMAQPQNKRFQTKSLNRQSPSPPAFEYEVMETGIISFGKIPVGFVFRGSMIDEGPSQPQEVLVSRSVRKIKPKRCADDEISSPVSATGKGQDEPIEGPPYKRPKRAPKTPAAAKTATPDVKEPAPAPTRARMVIGKGKGAAAAGKSPASGPSGRMSPDKSSPMPRVPVVKPAATAAAPSLRKSELAPSKRALPALIPAAGAASQAPLPPTRRAPSLRQQPKQEVFPQELEEEEMEQDEEEECETPPSLNLNADDNEMETDDKENVKESAPSSNANDSEEEQEAMESESEMENYSEMDDTSSRYSENIDESKIAFTDKEGQPFEVRFENKQDFENEEEKSEYETNLGGVAKIKEDIEQGDMGTHETLQELMEEGKDEFDPEDAILRERWAGQIRALKMEGEVIEIIGEIVSCLSEKQADYYRAVELLDRLGSHDLTALILKKHPEVVRIVGKLRNYVGNAENWTMSEDQLGEFKESASAIRGKAVDIYGSFYSLFIPPEERDSTVSFEDIFKEEMKVFKEMTMDMNLDEVLGLTVETEGGFEAMQKLKHEKTSEKKPLRNIKVRSQSWIRCYL